MYYSTIHALKPKCPLKYLKICIYGYSAVQKLFEVVNSIGFFSCGIETNVRHMINSHKQLKQKLVTIRTHRCQIVISNAELCQIGKQEI